MIKKHREHKIYRCHKTKHTDPPASEGTFHGAFGGLLLFPYSDMSPIHRGLFLDEHRFFPGSVRHSLSVFVDPLQAGGDRGHRLSPTELEDLIVAGCIGLCMCITPVTYYLAIMKTSVAKAVLQHYIAPLHVAILCPFLLKEKNIPLTLFAVGAGLLRTALINQPAGLLKGDAEEVIGIVSILISGIGLAGIFLFGKFLAGRLPSQIRALSGCVIVAILLFPFGIMVSRRSFLA